MREFAQKSLILTFLLVLPPIAFSQTTLTTAQIAKRVSPSVVVIEGKTDSGDVLGSGFIVSKDGKIVTNLHVIRDMKVATVKLATGEVFDSVSVLATDERRDLAVVKIAGFNLPVLALGNSDVTVGEPVVIVGSPSGLEGTVTAGILSSLRDSGKGFKVLQTDAAVNPGNSGGPLLNNRGQAIGVVSFKLRSAEGLNFAIPINYVRGLLDNIHEPLSLEQMQSGLAVPTSSDGNPAGLEQSLHSLKEALELESFRYVVSTDRGVVNVRMRQQFKDSGSCVATFGVTTVANDDPHLTTEIRMVVPLGEIAKETINRTEIDPRHISGDQWAYRVDLSMETAAASTTLTLPSEEPLSTPADNVLLLFHDESAAKRFVTTILRTADLCHNLSAAASPMTPSTPLQGDGPSLPETLDWLKQKIPLATVQSIRSVDQIGQAITIESTVCF